MTEHYVSMSGGDGMCVVDTHTGQVVNVFATEKGAADYAAVLNRLPYMPGMDINNEFDSLVYVE